MTGTGSEGARPAGRAQDAQPPATATGHQPALAAPAAEIRRRHAAALRMAPLDGGARDPLDQLAAQPPRPAPDDPGHYDAATLAMNCGHHEGCPAASSRNGA